MGFTETRCLSVLFRPPGQAFSAPAPWLPSPTALSRMPPSWTPCGLGSALPLSSWTGFLLWRPSHPSAFSLCLCEAPSPSSAPCLLVPWVIGQTFLSQCFFTGDMGFPCGDPRGALSSVPGSWLHSAGVSGRPFRLQATLPSPLALPAPLSLPCVTPDPPQLPVPPACPLLFQSACCGERQNQLSCSPHKKGILLSGFSCPGPAPFCLSLPFHFCCSSLKGPLIFLCSQF